MMHADQTTTDQSDLSGPDDSSYNSDPEHPASEEDDQTEMQTIASEDVLRDIVEQLLCKGHKGPMIRQILQEKHGISMSASTLTCRQKTWGLRQLERQQPTQPELLPHIRASLLSSHSKGLNLQEIQARLAKETGVQVCLRTVKQYLRRLQVKLNVNDLALGNVTLGQVPNGHPHPHPHPLAGIRRPQRVSERVSTDTRPLKGRRGGWKDFLPAVEYLDSWKEILPVDEVHVPRRLKGFPSSRRGTCTSSTGRISFQLSRYMYLAGWKETLPAGHLPFRPRVSVEIPGYPLENQRKGHIRTRTRIRWRVSATAGGYPPANNGYPQRISRDQL
ncbi:hypothetical protein PGT21_019973 [Puccinia graminis f. sp. tritici]|uniref:Uncharacterized protein n=1 Tax=Puccinia graminis f. sp. tritici TaxID=56615 RepID=A0A5B0MCD8_PUCGR|nr:hypothetical protein PGT21_019973 [Puccinia graminis f. sp. tritici]